MLTMNAADGYKMPDSDPRLLKKAALVQEGKINVLDWLNKDNHKVSTCVHSVPFLERSRVTILVQFADLLLVSAPPSPRIPFVLICLPAASFSVASPS